MEIQRKNLSVTIGIPTCYGERSLVETVKSIRSSQNVDPSFRFIIIADRTPLTEDIKNELKNLNVELHWNNQEGSQLKKIKQIVDMTDSDTLVITQDDITFNPETISNIVKAFENNPDATMLGARILPLPPKTFVESCLASMVRAIDEISTLWKDKQNHLAVSGRCLAFRTEHVKKFNFIEGVVTGDMFQYLENHRLGGKFIRPDDIIVYIRCPQHIKDQIGPSSRYQHSEEELSAIFGDIKEYYKIPLYFLVASSIKELIRHPISMIGYVLIYTYTRIFKKKRKKIMTPMWDVDKTTKNVI